MMLNYPVTSVPNSQAFPDNAFPASAYYGINSTLADTTAFSPSSSATNADGTMSLMPSQMNMSGLVIAFLIGIGVLGLWHYYYK
jgi:hypothetical protein